MPAKYVGQGGGPRATPEHLAGMIPDGHREFVTRVPTRPVFPPVPPDADRRVRKAAGLNVDAEGPGQLEVTLADPGVKLVVNALGPPPKYIVDRCHEAGLLVGALVGSRQHAERQIAQGVDVIVAQGTEAGGHCGEISTMVLIPQVVDAVGPDVPVLAAGGIADGRQVAAAMALGAQGVWTGSIWLLTSEADMAPEVTANLLVATSRTLPVVVMTGKPARQLRTSWTEVWERPDAARAAAPAAAANAGQRGVAADRRGGPGGSRGRVPARVVLRSR